MTKLLVDFSPFEECNTRLLTIRFRAKELYTLSYDDFPRFKVKKQGKIGIRPGLPCAHYWITSIAIGRAYITKVFVALCTSSPEHGTKLFLQGSGKRPRAKNLKTWLMWYPAPKPKNLKTWLQFLSSSDSYEVRDVLDVSPTQEGFYRFSVNASEGDKVSIHFDDKTNESDASIQQAYFLSEDGKNSRVYLQLTVPLHIRSSSKKKVNDIWGEGLLGLNENMNCFVLPMSPIACSGSIGPIRSNIPGHNQNDAWLNSLTPLNATLHEEIQCQAIAQESCLRIINRQSFPGWPAFDTEELPVKRKTRTKVERSTISKKKKKIAVPKTQETDVSFSKKEDGSSDDGVLKSFQ